MNLCSVQLYVVHTPYTPTIAMLPIVVCHPPSWTAGPRSGLTTTEFADICDKGLMSNSFCSCWCSCRNMKAKNQNTDRPSLLQWRSPSHMEKMNKNPDHYKVHKFYFLWGFYATYFDGFLKESFPFILKQDF